MAYNLPTLNLTVNVWHGTNFPPNVEDATYDCNLQFAQHSKADIATQLLYSSMYLLLPKGTDIRGAWDGLNPDTVEVPAGTGRYYIVLFVDDVGKGFANEYRVAAINQVNDPQATFGIPFPVPLP
jgi:hypothetical protein